MEDAEKTPVIKRKEDGIQNRLGSNVNVCFLHFGQQNDSMDNMKSETKDIIVSYGPAC